jgi:hypothetical protein
MRALRRWDDLSRKLHVGVYLRTGQLTDGAREHADRLREALEDVLDELKENRIDQAREKLPQFDDAYVSCRTFFLGT